MTTITQPDALYSARPLAQTLPWNFINKGELLSLIKQLFDGIKNSSKLPLNKRREFGEALADTCEMIDSVLTFLANQIIVRLKQKKGPLQVHLKCYLWTL